MTVLPVRRVYCIACQAYLKAAEASDDDLLAALSNIYSNRANGKELQWDVEAHGPGHAGAQEVRAMLLKKHLVQTGPSNVHTKLSGVA